MDEIITLFGFFGFFISLILIVFILSKYNYLIKKARIENGSEPISIKSRYLELGVIILSLGIGLGLASLLTIQELPQNTMYLLIYSIIFICGGIGSMLAYFIRKKSG